MRVHIVWTGGRPHGSRLRRVASALAALLSPAALVAFAVSFWSIAADLHWTNDFFVSTGLFSHWQVWVITASLLLISARLLTRYAERNEHFIP